MAAELSKRAPADIGERLYELARALYPINRSITGQGVRDTLAAIAKVVPLEVRSIPTGTPVFDWTIPREWNFREAYIEDAAGRRIVDAKHSNLHVVSYSTPVDATMGLAELRPHLHSLPQHPDWIPYRTSYYKEAWGFCIAHRQLQAMTEQNYRVRIDATLTAGVLNFGELVVPGETTDEFLITAHVCHPSLANDNLSGIAIAAWLGKLLADQKPRYTYRFLFAPGTIGSIAWLATSAQTVSKVKHGIVAALLGRPAPLTYKKTRRGDAAIDKIAAYVLRRRARGDNVIDFSPWGYDERQFNSPGIALDVGRLTRAAEGGYPEYHTSADNLALVTPEALHDAFSAFCEIIEVVEHDGYYLNLRGHGEPQLGKYGLYDSMGGASSVEAGRLALLWVLNQADGSRSLLEIAERSGLAFSDVALASAKLEHAGLLARTRPSGAG